MASVVRGLVEILFVIFVITDCGCLYHVLYKIIPTGVIYGNTTHVNDIDINPISITSDLHNLRASLMLLTLAYLACKNIIGVIGLSALYFGKIILNLYYDTCKISTSILFYMEVELPLQGMHLKQPMDFAWWGVEDWWSGLAFFYIAKQMFYLLGLYQTYKRWARATMKVWQKQYMSREGETRQVTTLDEELASHSKVDSQNHDSFISYENELNSVSAYDFKSCKSCESITD